MKQNVQLVVIDGQGGSLGKALVAAIKKTFREVEVLGIGTNSLAASAMLKSGADAIATGENPVIVACRNADLIVGPLGILTSDALHGEITPAMAVAIAQSKAHKILVPISKCNVTIVGIQEAPLSMMIDFTLEEIRRFLDSTLPSR
ncbi:DUF3842 family protein [uncultured Sphaerochaeta sp.]|jgi:hypothetical protein|uniref:DUF3842 family protein n=1 Tax=uncultured Sphaerochaeta sp. TaxID=886478 RepID=UPI0029CA425D|nr:DUF3842 family protein [uncultured Sphaerochaeta sp.]MCK9349386.1 DUF3842 family protein [Sphaerochaeta sp.]MDD4302443.1 DUF3842 family protein [Sphaerochaeta sp.]MDD4647027.1 DUF3842 family protein [Sphaerochaeta sp.]MDY0243344.1 DUF3842 family protein [Sphaerochaeta sp.]